MLVGAAGSSGDSTRQGEGRRRQWWVLQLYGTVGAARDKLRGRSGLRWGKGGQRGQAACASEP